MADLSEFQQYNKLAGFQIDETSREQLAECAKLLALNLARYQGNFGEIPLDETLSDLEPTEPNEEQAALLRDGMEILVGVPGNAMSGLGEETH